MELFVYKLPVGDGVEDEIYSAVLVDFESLQNQIEEGEEGFFLNAVSAEDLINQLCKRIRKEVKLQLSSNPFKHGKRKRKETPKTL